MPRQTTLDLRAEHLRTLWERLPARSRAEAVALWTQVILHAARSGPARKAGPKCAR